MAILDGVPGLEDQILVDGQPLVEYNDEDDSGIDSGLKTVSKFVEATSEKQFSIKYMIDRTFPYRTQNILIEVFVDGRRLRGKLPSIEKVMRGTTAIIDAHKFATSNQWFERKFRFSKLSIIEANADRATVHRVVRLVETRGGSRPETTVGEIDSIPEKALKGQALALSHSVSLAPPQPRQRSRTWTTDYIDPKDEPLVSYNFKYRSREALQGLHVIPRSPSPVPLEERDVDTLSVEELRELARIQQGKLSMQQIKTEVKRERADDDADDGDGIEIGKIRPVKRRVMEAIDLTDD